MSAVISECGRYRYGLERQLNWPGEGTVVFIGVNPSTADASLDDATIRKMRGFASIWGFERMVVVNLFAWRATDVRELRQVFDPQGPDWSKHFHEALTSAKMIVPCWGDRAKMPAEWRHIIDRVRESLPAYPDVRHLGLTKGGDPKHPLMLGYKTPLTRWANPQ